MANCQRGFLYIEVPDLDWILEKKAYFDLFHEHVNYFRKEDFARCFSTALCTTFSLFDGQYLGVILDLSRVMSCNEIVMVPSSYIESLASSFDFLVDHEMNTYGKLRAYNDLVIWGGSSKGVVFASKAPSNILKKIGYAIDINLKEGLNTIEFYALNEGRSSPNTAELKVIDTSGAIISSGQWLLTTGYKARLIVLKE